MARNIRDLAPLAFPVAGLVAAIGVAVLVFATHHGPTIPDGSPGAASVSQGAKPRPHHDPTAPGSAKPPKPPKPGETCVPAERTDEITVVTFNIHSARTGTGAVGLAQIGAELAAMKPDVVLLQEVDRGRAWSARLDMPSVLAKDLDMHWAFGDNVRRTTTNQYGTAILSRFPIVSWHNQLLPRPPGTQQRGLLETILDIDGVRTHVYVTHLENSSPTARLLQMRAIAPVLRADTGPKLLGGDFNSVSTSPVGALARSVLSDTWRAIGSGSGLTAPAGAPRVRIDYLYYGNGGDTTITPRSIEVMPRSAVSDHRAVRATYTLSTGSADNVCVPVIGQDDLP
ncbi:endonuclease/exonuclease/phosphatase family protein [Nocardioides mangrovi]|uniref:Endonuclease/exonuclease/phosphatase family protein n=1 Tax=Nocardioides mangrovi TaxID=2874580 RepID=A0ABS7U8J6_9ACTN|nr:endonuclease/exonuclease/phosphatase family protein [Nocardioides mangrovi]MBZ5737291.1 endonuclease/exonuclease/phosphatase family protein [Nocardioides mangrovi]